MSGVQGIARVAIHSATQCLGTLTLECLQLALADPQFQSPFAPLELFKLFDALPSPRQLIYR
jgi:hypothetical protein